MFQEKVFLTSTSGIPIVEPYASLTYARKAVLFKDNLLIEQLAHFTRETVRKRRVSSVGTGAFGYFVVTNRDITRYSKADVFSQMSRKTKVFVRFSPGMQLFDDGDTLRMTHTMSVKFYTQEGNWDLLTFNQPASPVSDPMRFPYFFHAASQNPRTNQYDLYAFFDYINLVPESINNFIRLYSLEGIPDGYRHMNGYAVNTFRLVSREGQHVYCKFNLLTDQGEKGMTEVQSFNILAVSRDYATRDLYNAIESKQFPTWTLAIQVMTEREAETCPFDYLDSTKVKCKIFLIITINN